MVTCLVYRAAITLCVAIASVAAITAQGPVSVSDARVALPDAGASSAIAALTIRNSTMYDVYVISASSEAAGRIEFRAAAPAGGDAPLLKELTVPAFGSLDLTPQGMHMVLKDLKRPLKAGETVTMMVSTDGGLTLKVTAEVKAP